MGGFDGLIDNGSIVITHKSKRREISDLQRLLVSSGYLTELDATERGKWREKTQVAILDAYAGIGWEHPSHGRWITAPALAAIAAASHAHTIVRNESTSRNGKGAAGPGSHAGGPGSHAGGPGSHAGGPGSHAG